MTSDQLKSLGQYVLWAFIGAVVATGLQLATALAGTDVILIRPLLATFMSSFFGAIATILGTSQLTRFGSESIAKQVDLLKAQGVPRSEMVVVTQAEAAHAAAPRTLDQITEDAIRIRAERLAQQHAEKPVRLREVSNG